MKRCQICGKEITRGKNPKFHPICIKRLYGTRNIPTIALTAQQITLAYQKKEENLSIASLQKRVPLTLNRRKKQLELCTNGSGEFILKPQIISYASIPYIENICMTAASLMGISVPFHSLVKMKDSRPAYLERRFDQVRSQPGHRVISYPVKKKTVMQVMEKKNKYSGDLLDIGKKILQVSEFPGLDVQLFLEVIIFSFIVGYNDLNAGSFTLLYDLEDNIRLSPAYDICSTKMIFSNVDDFSVPLDGKKIEIHGHDFLNFALKLRIHEKAYSKIFLRFFRGKRRIGRLIKESALPYEEKIKFSDLINERFKRLFS